MSQSLIETIPLMLVICEVNNYGLKVYLNEPIIHCIPLKINPWHWIWHELQN